MGTLAQILFFTFLAGVLSLVGGIALLTRTTWVKKFSAHFVSFAAGALLATAFLDLLPEAMKISGDNSFQVFSLTLSGIVLFFIFERIIFKYHSHTLEDPGHHHATPVLLMAGDAFHNFIDGVAIAATFLVSPALGVLTALAVAAHELPQEIGDFSILVVHNWKRSKVLWINILISLTSIAGALLTYSARNLVEPYLPMLLALTAGNFIYIATADLFPEISASYKPVDKTSHIIGLFLAGIACVWAFIYFLGKLA